MTIQPQSSQVSAAASREWVHATLPEVHDMIAGERVRPANELGFWVSDSSTGEALQRARSSSPEQIERALAAANAGFQGGSWSGLDAELRADALDKVAQRLEARVGELAELDARTSGVTITWTALMTRLVPVIFRQASKALRRGLLRQLHPGRYGAVEVRAVPLGPVALIGPWNAPTTIIAHKLASALAAGCNVIIKPSEHVPHSTGLLVDAVLEAGLPTDVVQLLHGDGAVGNSIVSDPRIKAVSFTGGLTGGRAVAAACAQDLKPVQLELGGNNPLLVLADADLDAAAEAIVAGLTTLNGQWCRAIGRVIVDRSVMAPMLELVKTKLGTVRLGHSLDPQSDMGPLVHRQHLAQIQQAQQSLLKAPSSTALNPTATPALQGHFHPPTLLCGVPHEQALEELFGPVATVHPFTSETEAISLANAGRYGLAAYVFGDEQRALELAGQIRAGSTQVNGLSLLSLAPTAPRAAWGLSGLGDEGTLETLRFFTGHRVIGVGGQPVRAEA
ncbi:MAG: aldehyde dehydrogenase [Rickettsiales bacterium]|nr:aldehyde dehydrogenase [Rickettsiales bacterium]